MNKYEIVFRGYDDRASVSIEADQVGSSDVWTTFIVLNPDEANIVLRVATQEILYIKTKFE